MKPEKRMTKRQIKEDRLVSTTFKVTEYVQKNKNPFIIGAAALVAIFAIIMVVRWSGKNKIAESASILSRAELTAGMGNQDQYIADLKLLADDYSNTDAGKMATLRLANTFFEKKDYDNALVYFNKITERYSDDKMMASGASAGKGACYESKGNYLEAAKAYLRAAEYNSGDIWTPNYLLRAGQNYAKAGDKNSAQAAFDKIEKTYSNTPENNLARRALAELKY